MESTILARRESSGSATVARVVEIETQSQYLIAGIGLFLTGVAVPFLGLFSVIFCHYTEEKKSYFVDCMHFAFFLFHTRCTWKSKV